MYLWGVVCLSLFQFNKYVLMASSNPLYYFLENEQDVNFVLSEIQNKQQQQTSLKASLAQETIMKTIYKKEQFQLIFS